jgi:hypothetical protein
MSVHETQFNSLQIIYIDLVSLVLATANEEQASIDYIKKKAGVYIFISHVQLFDVGINMSDAAICLCTMQLNTDLKIQKIIYRPARPLTMV